MKYLLPKTNYYKANLHTHSNISDGKLTPDEVKAFYKEHGYSILALTDHNVTIDHSDMTEPDFLMITGVEVDIAQENARKTVHLCMLSRDPHLQWIPFKDAESLPHMHAYEDLCQCENLPQVYSPEAINRVIAKANEKGFLVTYNHPAWSLEYYEDYSKYEGLWAMEYANSGSLAIGYDANNGWVYREFINMGKPLLPIMADDAHSICHKRTGHPVAGMNWTMVAAEKLEYNSVMDALARGDLYSSNGPKIHSLTWDDGILRVECSPVAKIQLIKNSRPFRFVWGEIVTEAEFNLKQWYDKAVERGDGWFYLLVTDENGKCAVTRAYTPADLT